MARTKKDKLEKADYDVDEIGRRRVTRGLTKAEKRALAARGGLHTDFIFRNSPPRNDSGEHQLKPETAPEFSQKYDFDMGIGEEHWVEIDRAVERLALAQGYGNGLQPPEIGGRPKDEWFSAGNDDDTSDTSSEFLPACFPSKREQSFGSTVDGIKPFKPIKGAGWKAKRGVVPDVPALCADSDTLLRCYGLGDLDACGRVLERLRNARFHFSQLTGSSSLCKAEACAFAVAKLMWHRDVSVDRRAKELKELGISREQFRDHVCIAERILATWLIEAAKEYNAATDEDWWESDNGITANNTPSAAELKKRGRHKGRATLFRAKETRRPITTLGKTKNGRQRVWMIVETDAEAVTYPPGHPLCGDIDQALSALTRMRRAQADAMAGDVTMIKAFSALGIPAAQLSNLSPDELLQRVITALEKASPSAQKTADAIFGRIQDKKVGWERLKQKAPSASPNKGKVKPLNPDRNIRFSGPPKNPRSRREHVCLSREEMEALTAKLVKR